MAMEIISYSSSSCCYPVNQGRNLGGKSSNSQSKVSNFRNPRLLLSAKLDYKSGNLGICKPNRPFLRNLNQGSFRSFNSKVLAGNYDGYVIEAEDEARSISGGRGESVTRVLIPGLPEESGESPAEITGCFWEWKPKLRVHYDKAGWENTNSPAVLFLPGFGVGSFHYEKQLKDLGRDHRVWALDFLGQGMSMPSEDPAPMGKDSSGDESERNVRPWGFGDETEPWASDLVYSLDLWRDQVQHFIEEVIGEPVYVVGNSLGGYVALYFAACNPRLVKGITLLNATPFWGFLPNPLRSPRLAKLFPWAGTFPLPSRVRKLTELLWQKISDPSSIIEILKQVYADHSTNVDKVYSRIVETTQHPAAAASLASIMFAPQGQLSFDDALSRCQTSDLPICLMYGKEDPWVRPVWGLQVKRKVPEAPYYEISPAGHCPHDEVPEVVNFLLRGWIGNLETDGSVELPLLSEQESKAFNASRDLEFPRDGSQKSVKVRFFGARFSFWNLISSFALAHLGGLEFKS